MEAELGRYLAAHPLPTQRFLVRLVDLGRGLGRAVSCSVEGLELVFRAGGGGRGFLRVSPSRAGLRLAFPRGGELYDPGKRLDGVPGLEHALFLFDEGELDLYVRRLIEGAHALDG